MGDLVLRTRVAVARRNLKRVRELSRTVEMRLSGLDKFLNLPQTLRVDLDDAWNTSHELEALARDYQDESPQLLEEVQSLTQQLNKIGRDLKKKCDEAVQLRNELVQLFSQRRDVDDFLLQSARQLEPILTVNNYFQNQKRIDALF